MVTKLNQDNKQIVLNYWQTTERYEPHNLKDRLCRYLDADMLFHGPDPINQLQGPDDFLSGFWIPLSHSFENLRRQTHVFFGGRSSGRINGLGDGEMWVCGTGFFNGTFARDYLTIPASGKPVNIRWGEFCRMRDGKIVESYCLLDLIDLMQQAGFQVLPASQGADGMWLLPRANDGVMLDERDERTSLYSLEHIRKFIFEGLNNYDQTKLESMGMADFFHPGIKWYGPGGIGACLNFTEFECLHQQPWLKAFPDRAVQDLGALFAEGLYSGASGFAGVKATHKGTYLEVPATGNPLEINGLDYWKREGEVYVENWVFVDMIHLFRQLGVDLFERLHSARQKGQTLLGNE
jgi:predicted ester cyclase